VHIGVKLDSLDGCRKDNRGTMIAPHDI